MPNRTPPRSPAGHSGSRPSDSGGPAGRERAVNPGRQGWMVLVLTALMVIGTLGYWLIDDFPLFDAFYMTVITLTTVGYGEVRPLSTAGRAFTILLLLGGVFTFFFVATEFLRLLVTGEL